MHNPTLSIQLVGGDETREVRLCDDSQDLTITFDDESALRQAVESAVFGLGLLVAADTIGFEGAADWYGIEIED